MKHSIIDIILHRDELHQELHLNSEYQKAFKRKNKLYEEFRETLPDELKEKFDKVEEAEVDEQCVKAENYFKAGVKAGIRLAAECMFDN